MKKPPPIEVYASPDGWFTVRRYEIHDSGWVTWQVGNETGLVPPKKWRYRESSDDFPAFRTKGVSGPTAI